MKQKVNEQNRATGKYSPLNAIYNRKMHELMRRVTDCHASTCYLCTVRTFYKCLTKMTMELRRRAWEAHPQEMEKLQNIAKEKGLAKN